MTTRSLTEVFILMRNNAIQSKHIYSEQNFSSDQISLVHMEDVEAGGSIGRRGAELREDTSMPPPWIDSLEEAQYVMTRLRTKISALTQAHAQHLHRPTLEDGGPEEQLVGRLTSEISRHFNMAHRLVQNIKAQCRQGTKMEQTLTRNVISSLVCTLQNLSNSFRAAQSNYLKTLTSREERSNAYFELPNFDELNMNDEFLAGFKDRMESGPGPSTSMKNSQNSSAFFEEEDQDIDVLFQNPALSQKQLLLIQEENTKMAAQREEEVNKIVQSILDINDIFKDLANMVNDQGTILDRIDYNIENTQSQVRQGLKQLQKADSYHRNNRKMHCIFILACSIIFVTFLLIFLK